MVKQKKKHFLFIQLPNGGWNIYFVIFAVKCIQNESNDFKQLELEALLHLSKATYPVDLS